MRRLFCAVWFVVGWFVPAATADGGALGQLRAADTVRLVVDQSFVYTARTDYRKKVIRGFRMPFAEVARDLLEGAGARVVGPDTEGAGPAGATVTVTARGRAIDRLYIDDVTGYLFTGAEIIGEIVVDAPGANPWRSEFRSQHGPAQRVQINLGYDLPEGAPFAQAFGGPTSYIARIMDMIGWTYGPPPLIAALDSRDVAVRTHAARVLGVVGGEGAGEALLAALRDADPLLRKQAAWSLGRLGDPGAVFALTLALDDPDGDVRWFAGWALSKIGERAPEAAADAAAAPTN